MRITIIGWYGTETIGDRAILAGLFSFFSKTYEDFEVYLGSLYPFFSERTIYEDYNFWKEITGRKIKIKTFSSKNPKELDSYIAKSDLVCVGGGPLMDLSELFMLEYAFKKARKAGKKTALLGCGVGPLFNPKYKKTVLEIAKISDIIILRDGKSKENLLEIAHGFHRDISEKSISTSFDPAVECTMQYNHNNTQMKDDYIAVNLREFPTGYSDKIDYRGINEELQKFVADLADTYQNNSIKLIPMHYFHVGNDDRDFLNRIALKIKRNNIEVQNCHLSLEETVRVFQNAYFNIGMRFHSVVIQTITSGNNYILDYTEPKKGKISGFLKDIDRDNFYKTRYISLQDEGITTSILSKVEDKFDFDEKAVKNRLKIYIDKLNEIPL